MIRLLLLEICNTIEPQTVVTGNVCKRFLLGAPTCKALDDIEFLRLTDKFPVQESTETTTRNIVGCQPDKSRWPLVLVIEMALRQRMLTNMRRPDMMHRLRDSCLITACAIAQSQVPVDIASVFHNYVLCAARADFRGRYELDRRGVEGYCLGK